MSSLACLETSLMMALHPDLVQMENLPSDPEEWPVAVGGKDPRRFASRELGQRAIQMQCGRMAEILAKALQSCESAP